MTGPHAAEAGAEAPVPPEIWELRLYVTGRSPKCVRAIENLQVACEQHLAGQYHIEVVDLLENPRLAADDQILAVPTLVRKLPPPIRKIVGDLSNTDRLLVGLQLRPRERRGNVTDIAADPGELQNLLLGWPDVVGFLQQLAALSAALVPRTSCGVTMRRDHQAATVASSDEFAMLLGEIQYGRGQGPCLQALRTGERVKVADLATDDRWGEYRLHALAAGVRSSVSLPLTVNDATIGSVNLYSRARNSFGKKDIRRAKSLALQAGDRPDPAAAHARQTESGPPLRGGDMEELRRRARRGTRNIAHHPGRRIRRPHHRHRQRRR